MDLERAHQNMILQQLQPAGITDPRVLDAMQRIPRHDFLPSYLAGLAYADTELPIGYGQRMLSPLFYAQALQVLALTKEMTVLHIGHGSGYFSALLAQMAGQVLAVELIPELLQQADARLGRIDIHNVISETGDASLRWPLPDRIDAIVATAAFSALPDEYCESLKVGGRLFAVIDDGKVMQAKRIIRTSERAWETITLFTTQIPLMMSPEAKAVFEF